MGNSQKIDAFFNAFNSRVQEAIKEVPQIVGNEAINFVLDNFKNESYEGKKWAPRKRKPKRGAGNQQLLVQSGIMRRSIGVLHSSPTRVTVGSPIRYASIHNNGGSVTRNARSETFKRNRITKGKKKGLFAPGTNAGRGLSFKASSFNMPQRQFLGPSKILKARINKEVKEHLLNAFKS